MEMERLARTTLTRRQLERAALALPAPLALALLSGRTAGIAFAQPADETATPPAGSTPILAPTPACGDHHDLAPTIAQTEGPYFTPNSPERASLLEPRMPGRKLVVTGYVYSTDCRPVRKALLDFWQANDAGHYDNVGFTLRGHQFTDKDGRYELTTIVPGLYPGRTRHIHVKVQAANGPVLTSQLYFPDEPANATDGIFDPALVMDLQNATNAKEGRVGFFTFVVR
jgi:protocatechuate 3,4-dioxygenase beta subunit